MQPTKDLFSAQSNTYGGNNQYGYSNNALPGSNTYSGSMGTNTNLLPGGTPYGGSMTMNNNALPGNSLYPASGSMGVNNNMMPSGNVYSGSMGMNNQNTRWSDNNRYNPSSPGSSWYANRDTNNVNPNTNYAYGNQVPFYLNDSAGALSLSILLLFCSCIAHLLRS